VQVILDFLLVWDITRTITLRAGTPDRLLWKWTSDQNFSTASAYKAFFIGQHSIPGAKILSKTRAPGKCKFFGWLVLHDRCWTYARRRRHNLQTDDSCALCCQESETITHLLVGCSLAREIWYAVLLRLHWQQLAPGSYIFCLADWWSSARKLIPKINRRSFDSMVILISWILWNERNRRVFDHQVRTSRQLLDFIADEAVQWVLASYSQVEKLALAHWSRICKCHSVVLVCSVCLVGCSDTRTLVFKFFLSLNEIRAQSRSLKKHTCSHTDTEN